MVRAKRQMRDQPLNEGRARTDGKREPKYIRYETQSGVIYRLNIINRPQGTAYNTNRGELENKVENGVENPERIKNEEDKNTEKCEINEKSEKSESKENGQEAAQEAIDGKVIYLSEQTARRQKERQSRKTNLKGHEIELLDGRKIYVEAASVAEAIRQQVEIARKAYDALRRYQSPFKYTFVPDENYTNGPNAISPRYLEERLQREVTGLEPADVRVWTNNGSYISQTDVPIKFDPVMPDRLKPKRRREPPVGLRYLYGEGNFARRMLH